jgi:hypothetical protein
MKEDVSLELAEEEERERVRIGAANGAGFHRAREVVREQFHRAARRNLLGTRIEGNDHRGGVHLHGDGGTDDLAEEREESSRELAQDCARIGFGIEFRQSGDELGDSDRARGHRGAEERLLGIEVAEDGRGRDIERSGDVRKGGGGEAARGEGGAGGVEDLVSRDARRAAHGVSKRRFTNCVCQWAFTNAVKNGRAEARPR